MGALVALARDQHRKDNEALDKKKSDDLDVLELFEAGVGQEHIDFVNTILPSLGINKHMVTPIPTGLGPCFELHPPDSRGVSRGLAWASSTQKTNLASQLEHLWRDNHKTVEHNVCNPIEPPPLLHTDCCLAGQCLCTGSGVALRSFRTALQRAMKRRFNLKSTKKFLDDWQCGHVLGFIRHKSCS